VFETRIVLRHEAVHPRFQVFTSGRIGIFHDHEAAAGVLAKHADKALSRSSATDLLRYHIRDFLEALPSCLDPDFFLMDHEQISFFECVISAARDVRGSQVERQNLGKKNRPA
jgi:hypothetical protein